MMTPLNPVSPKSTTLMEQNSFTDDLDSIEVVLFQSKASGSQGEEDGAEDEEEESGDEADLSKYDLWGSDEEQGNSSKAGISINHTKLLESRRRVKKSVVCDFKDQLHNFLIEVSNCYPTHNAI